MSLRARFSEKSGRDYFEAAAEAVVEFNAIAISAAAGRIAYVKPQFAFYEQLGSAGWAALETTVQMAQDAGLLVIGDAKRGDISSTASAYARAILGDSGPLGCDAVTLSPWMGIDTLSSFLPYCRDAGKGVFVLARTTNPASAHFQTHGEPRIVDRLADSLAEISSDMLGESGFSPIGIVVGASAAAEAQKLRQRLPSAWFLVPGMGAQGGSAAMAMAGCRDDGFGSLPVCSRSLLFPTVEQERFDSETKSVIAAAIDSHITLLSDY